jgi:putative PIN family toxin of toxin-antitoxin system
MRIMLDTNVLISVMIFPNPRMNSMMEYIFSQHELVLSTFILEELKVVIADKFPTKTSSADLLLQKMNYELVKTPEKIDLSLFNIRDKMNAPILYSAVQADVDILITGDKDFADVEYTHPKILTPTTFLAKYMGM